MATSSVLVRQELLDLVVVRVRHVARSARLALALLGAAGQQVSLEHALELELAGGSSLEALLGTGVGLYLGHIASAARVVLMPQSGPFAKTFAALWRRFDLDLADHRRAL